jgi:integrase
VQKWIENIALTDKTKDGESLSHSSLMNIKSLLSGIFSRARGQGYSDEANPVAGCFIPPTREAEDTYAYNLDEIKAMLAVLPEPARTLVAVAALTGARRGELRGLRWENYADGQLFIRQSVWKKYVNHTAKDQKIQGPDPGHSGINSGHRGAPYTHGQPYSRARVPIRGKAAA